LPGSGRESERTGETDGQETYLVRQARQGDVACFGELVHRHERAVYAVVARMLPSRDEADDLVQEVFLAAWKGIGRFRGDAKFGTWLHTIAVNATLRRLKSLSRSSAASLDDPDAGLGDQISGDPGDGPLEQVCCAEDRAAVRSALQKLSDNHRMVVVLYYYEQYTCDQIARVMGCSVGTVWSRLHYACKRLKVELDGLRAAAGAEGVTESAAARDQVIG